MAFQTFQDVSNYQPTSTPTMTDVAQYAAQSQAPQSHGWLADAITNMVNSGWKSLRTVPEFMLSYLPQKLVGSIKGLSELAQGKTPSNFQGISQQDIQNDPLGAFGKGFSQIDYKPLLLSEEEGKQLNQDPIRQYLGSSAEIGSYILPGALGAANGATALARIGSAAGHAAAGGALGGLGSGLKQDLTAPEILGQVGQGAALGGALGGAFQGGAEGLKWLGNKINPEAIQNKGEAIQAAGQREQMQGGLGVEGKPGQLDFTGARAMDEANIKKGLDLAGLKGATPENVSQIPEALGNLRDNAVANSPLTIKASDFQQRLADKLYNEGIVDSTQQATIDAGKIIDLMKPKDLPAEQAINNTFNLSQFDLHGLTQNDSIQSSLSKFYQAVRRGAEGDLKPIILERQAADSLAKDLIGQAGEQAGISAAGPTYNEINQIYSSLYRQNPNMVATMNAARPTMTSMGRANLFKVIQAPVERKVGEAIQTIGKGVSGIGNLGENIAQSPLGNILQSAGQTVGNAVNTAIPIVSGPLAVAGMNANQQKGDILPTGVFDQQQGGQLYPGQSPQNIYTTPYNGGATPNPIIQTSNQANPYAKLPQMVQAGFTVDEAMKILAPQAGKVVPATVKVQFAALQSGIDQINQLSNMIDQGKQYFGRGQDTLGQALANIFPNADRSALQARITTTLYNVARAAHGAGVMSNQDIQMFKKDLAPSFGDTPEEAQAKLEQAVSILEDKLNNLNAQYAQ